MTFPLSTAYPQLAALAVAGGTSLDALATQAPRTDGALNLHTCCHLVANGIKELNVPDAYSYLRTYDRFLATFEEARMPRKRFWTKLKNPGASEFMDTVSEVAIALAYEREGGHVFELEKEFVVNGVKRDADMFLTTPAGSIWVDVASMSGSKEPANDTSAFLPNAEALSDGLHEKIFYKYKNKFRDAVDCGVLPKGRVWVFISILKAEMDFVAERLLAQLLGTPLQIRIPESVWAPCPGLGGARVFDLLKGSDGLVHVTNITSALRPDLQTLLAAEE